MQIRSAQIDDFEQVSKLLLQLNPSDPKLSSESFTTYKNILDSEHLILLVAEENGILLGSCYLNIILNLTRGARPYAVIENVITDKNYRNSGIGKALMDKALEIAWEADCYKVMLMTGRKEESIDAFYKKCGFNADEMQAYILRAEKNG